MDHLILNHAGAGAAGFELVAGGAVGRMLIKFLDLTDRHYDGSGHFWTR